MRGFFLCSRSRQTVALNLLRARTLPGSWSFVLSGKNSAGKTPYYSQTVAFRGCRCHDQHDITVGITQTYKRPPETCLFFKKSLFFSTFIRESLLSNRAFRLHSTALPLKKNKSNCTQSDHMFTDELYVKSSCVTKDVCFPARL